MSLGLKVISSCLFALMLSCVVLTTVSAQVPTPLGKVTKLAGGFRFTEGPAWDGVDSLYFSDMPNGATHRWSESDGVTLVRQARHNSNGIVVTQKGGLVFCEGGRRIVLRQPDGEEKVLADQCEGRPLGMPNDLWMAPTGIVYFTIPIIKSSQADRFPEDALSGTICVLSSDFTDVREVGYGLKNANGIVGSADGKRLYVADPRAQKCYRYQIGADGSLSDQQVAAARFSDGLTLDEHGNLYTTSNEGVRVFSLEGEEIALIETPEIPANMTFGGRDGRTLFITARTSLYAVRMNVRGDYTTQNNNESLK
ncbi:Gluconolactonase precursor [Bremerella volcania]|uniref:Gluconolactonase n=1 Tax=Bremerella volcania TaxID=2527984 RepID=A0A518C3E3_9BACT|nr:SMP-30/gluconolactonase/LRE family protein [Bremerella volcania]QDU73752.1 Gluconolactonase precursor [Bremerella volcania]